MADTTKVTTGKPKIGGAVHRAPLNSTLPTDSKTALDEAFKSLGYIGDEGMTNTNAPESEEIKAWGGDIVLTSQTQKSDTFNFKLIEALNTEVLKTVYGDDNVTAGVGTETTVKVNSSEAKACAWVIEMITNGGGKKRIVIPNGKITELGEVVYNDSELVGYEITVAAFPDEEGNTHYEYIA